MLPVVQHAVRHYESKHRSAKVGAVMLLQPTSPLRTYEDINRCLEIFKGNPCDSLVSVYEGIHHLKNYDQDGNPYLTQVPYDKRKYRCYTRNGAIFLMSRELLDSGRLYTEKPILYAMPKSRSVDVDSMDDLIMAEAILKYGGERK
jgi:CMP-N,N'-diacetyllegionaminic acid synthase